VPDHDGKFAGMSDPNPGLPAADVLRYGMPADSRQYGLSAAKPRVHVHHHWSELRRPDDGRRPELRLGAANDYRPAMFQDYRRDKLPDKYYLAAAMCFNYRGWSSMSYNPGNTALSFPDSA
jgi:hypothetical protein